MNRRVLFVAILIIISLNISGQPGNPSPGPIGGVIYLLLGGIGYGIYKLRKNKLR